MPPEVTEVLGDEAAAALAQWAAETFALRDQAMHRDEQREIVSRLDLLDHDTSGVKSEVTELRHEMSARFDAVHGRFDAMEDRFDNRFDRLQSEMNACFDRMYTDMNARLDAINARIDTIHDVVRSQTRWLIATPIAVGGLISVLITIFEFIK